MGASAIYHQNTTAAAAAAAAAAVAATITTTTSYPTQYNEEVGIRQSLIMHEQALNVRKSIVLRKSIRSASYPPPTSASTLARVRGYPFVSCKPSTSLLAFTHACTLALASPYVHAHALPSLSRLLPPVQCGWHGARGGGGGGGGGGTRQ